MSTFRSEKWERMLKHANTSKNNSITCSREYMMAYRDHITEGISMWMAHYKKADPKRHLALMYIANDIVQHGKHSNIPSEFEKSIFEAYKLSLPKADAALRKGFKKLVDTWRNRSVFSTKFLDSLGKVLASTSDSTKRPNIAPLAKVTTPKVISAEIQDLVTEWEAMMPKSEDSTYVKEIDEKWMKFDSMKTEVLLSKGKTESLAVCMKKFLETIPVEEYDILDKPAATFDNVDTPVTEMSEEALVAEVKRLDADPIVDWSKLDKSTFDMDPETSDALVQKFREEVDADSENRREKSEAANAAAEKFVFDEGSQVAVEEDVKKSLHDLNRLNSVLDKAIENERLEQECTGLERMIQEEKAKAAVGSHDDVGVEGYGGGDSMHDDYAEDSSTNWNGGGDSNTNYYDEASYNHPDDNDHYHHQGGRGDRHHHHRGRDHHDHHHRGRRRDYDEFSRGAAAHHSPSPRAHKHHQGNNYGRRGDDYHQQQEMTEDERYQKEYEERMAGLNGLHSQRVSGIGGGDRRNTHRTGGGHPSAEQQGDDYQQEYEERMARLNGLHHRRVDGLEGGNHNNRSGTEEQPVKTYSRTQRILPLQGDVTNIGWD